MQNVLHCALTGGSPTPLHCPLERLCCQAEKMAEGLASPALLLSAHLGPCTGTCVPCARGPELLCLGPGLTCLSLPRATAACPACAEVRD